MKIKGLYLDTEGAHYSFKASDKMNASYVKLFRSKFGNWMPNYKGKKCAQLSDDGNGIVMTFDDGKTIALNYCEQVEAFLLLQESLSAPGRINSLPKRLVTMTKGKSDE